MKLNNLSTSVLSVGQTLVIPIENSDIQRTYTVQRGDTLYSIAKKYNTTVEEIKRANNLSNNILSVGQNIIIP